MSRKCNLNPLSKSQKKRADDCMGGSSFDVCLSEKLPPEAELCKMPSRGDPVGNSMVNELSGFIVNDPVDRELSSSRYETDPFSS